jgi:hypothetical protein
MEVGMLWFDNDPHTVLTAMVACVADHYRMKYGVVPDLCLVHPSMINGPPDLVMGSAEKVTIRPCRTILPGHLWIACEDNN